MKQPKQIARIMAAVVLSVGYLLAMWKFLTPTYTDDPLLIEPSSIALQYDPDGRTLTQRGEQEGCDAVINAGYFGYDEAGRYVPAGLWHHGDDIRPHLAPSDPNLTNTVSFTHHTNEGIIEQNMGRTTAVQTPDVDRFSAGPLLLVEGDRYLESGQDISHRAGRHPRTILMIDQKRRISFALFREPITLDEVTEILLSETSNLSAINLDGGPSTAYRSSSRPETSFRPETTLPIVFCLQE